jgi:hypothetical protein
LWPANKKRWHTYRDVWRLEFHRSFGIRRIRWCTRVYRKAFLGFCVILTRKKWYLKTDRAMMWNYKIKSQKVAYLETCLSIFNFTW